MKKILLFALLIPSLVISQTNPGFESGDLTGWTDAHSGTESISTTNVRTGTYALSYATNNSSNQRMVNSATFSVPNNYYLHCIGWAIGSNADSKAGVTIYNGSTWDGATSIVIGTTLTRCTHSRRNTSGDTVKTFQIGLNSSKVSNATILYWDDVVAYVSDNSTTDITDPNPPTGVTAVSNEAGTAITVTWTDGTDAATGSTQALILRKAGLNQTAPTLNDQGRYSTGGGSDGPNTVDSWTVVGVVDVGTQTFTDNSVSPNTEYTYAVYMRDLAYNYSIAATNSIKSLPVELTSFNAFVEKDKVKLTWSTATEVNNLGFDIERKCENGEWKKIGFVQGHGNSNSPKNYTYTDQPIGGINFKYRLKQIDFDGTYEYSPEVEAKLDEVKQFVLEQNYPNPFNPTTTIRFSLPVSAEVTINVFNLLGEKVAELVNNNLNAGYHEISFDGSKLTSGIYFYQLRAGEFKATKKFIIAK